MSVPSTPSSYDVGDLDSLFTPGTPQQFSGSLTPEQLEEFVARAPYPTRRTTSINWHSDDFHNSIFEEVQRAHRLSEQQLSDTARLMEPLTPNPTGPSRINAPNQSLREVSANEAHIARINASRTTNSTNSLEAFERGQNTPRTPRTARQRGSGRIGKRSNRRLTQSSINESPIPRRVSLAEEVPTTSRTVAESDLLVAPEEVLGGVNAPTPSLGDTKNILGEPPRRASLPSSVGYRADGNLVEIDMMDFTSFTDGYREVMTRRVQGANVSFDDMNMNLDNSLLGRPLSDVATEIEEFRYGGSGQVAWYSSESQNLPTWVNVPKGTSRGLYVRLEGDTVFQRIGDVNVMSELNLSRALKDAFPNQKIDSLKALQRASTKGTIDLSPAEAAYVPPLETSFVSQSAASEYGSFFMPHSTKLADLQSRGIYVNPTIREELAMETAFTGQGQQLGGTLSEDQARFLLVENNVTTTNAAGEMGIVEEMNLNTSYMVDAAPKGETIGLFSAPAETYIETPPTNMIYYKHLGQNGLDKLVERTLKVMSQADSNMPRSIVPYYHELIGIRQDLHEGRLNFQQLTTVESRVNALIDQMGTVPTSSVFAENYPNIVNARNALYAEERVMYPPIRSAGYVPFGGSEGANVAQTVNSGVGTIVDVAAVAASGAPGAELGAGVMGGTRIAMGTPGIGGGTLAVEGAAVGPQALLEGAASTAGTATIAEGVAGGAAGVAEGAAGVAGGAAGAAGGAAGYAGGSAWAVGAAVEGISGGVAAELSSGAALGSAGAFAALGGATAGSVEAAVGQGLTAAADWMMGAIFVEGESGLEFSPAVIVMGVQLALTGVAYLVGHLFNRAAERKRKRAEEKARKLAEDKVLAMHTNYENYAFQERQNSLAVAYGNNVFQGPREAQDPNRLIYWRFPEIGGERFTPINYQSDSALALWAPYDDQKGKEMEMERQRQLMPPPAPVPESRKRSRGSDFETTTSAKRMKSGFSSSVSCCCVPCDQVKK